MNMNNEGEQICHAMVKDDFQSPYYTRMTDLMSAS